MMPAEIMARTVTVGSDAGPKSLHLGDERLPAKAFEILIHSFASQDPSKSLGLYADRVASFPFGCHEIRVGGGVGGATHGREA